MGLGMPNDSDVDKLVHHFCCAATTAHYGPYTPPDGPNGHLTGSALIPGRLYRYRLVDREQMPVDIHVYVGLADIGGMLWEQEIRVLLRLGVSALPGLAEILEGGYEDAATTAAVGTSVQGIAFVATRGSDYTLEDPGASEAMRARPLVALSQFVLLADALAELHDLGVTHRNLMSAAIYADIDADTPRLWIARFEMSALIGNLLRSSLDSGTRRDELRELFLGVEPDRRQLACLPPERVQFLFPDDHAEGLRDTATADVYGLAAIVWEWFCNPDDLPDVPIDWADHASVRAAHEALGKAMRQALACSSTLPTRLTDVLTAMLDVRPSARPTAAEVATRLRQDSDALRVSLDSTRRERPFLVVHMPRQSDETLLARDWISQSATTEPGREELAAFIVEDLQNARLVLSPHGAEPFVRGGSAAERREARFVLLGRRIAWFCQYFWRRTWAGQSPPLEEALIIKYVVERTSPRVERMIDELARDPLRVEVPGIETVAMTIDARSMDAQLAGRPSWKELVDQLTPPTPESGRDLEYGRALDWLLTFQGAELRARTYPFTRVGALGDEVKVEWERETDRQYVLRDALLTKLADSPWLRPAFGDFFGNLEEEDHGYALVEVGEDENGRPRWLAERSVWQVSHKEGEDRVILRRRPGHGGRALPAKGWLRPYSDQGTQSALNRQADARWDLLEARGLLSQLRNPRSIRTPQQRWEQAGAELEGENSQETVRSMLACQPLYAIQGPPGTGKTTVVAEAVAGYLEAEPTARVLVSAQSGYALDNLAQRILERVGELGPDGKPADEWPGVALRITSYSGTPPTPTVQPWTRSELAVRQAGRIRARVGQVLRDRVGSDSLRLVLEEWAHLLDPGTGDNVHLELGDRLERAANLVFATCATATAQAVTPSGTRSRFDWVIVEEAAKAWPTELSMPLSRGTRWTLIGDHKQLGAHRRADFERFLDSCRADPNPEIADLFHRREDYLDVFDTFRRLFRPLDDPNLTDEARTRLPLRRLTTQFRMRPPIAEIVSRVFYPEPNAARLPDGLPPGTLTSGREVAASPLRKPQALAGASVVWIDTHDVADCADEPRWRNPGEARVVGALVDLCNPRPEPYQNGFSGEPLAVLTPYRQQLDQLRQYGALRDYLYTIHSFQGREADIVITSLVRDRQRGHAEQTWASLGHLAQRNLINVMMSRARKLLVIVGDFHHFSRVDADTSLDDDERFWGRLCTAVQLYGTVVPATEVIGE
ncbi:AAA domain-containing protein [Microbispora triticiradicis]|nr:MULTISPECIES: AAA domain-containing protein [Microbispora]